MGMTDAERDELIEKSLLNGLDEASEAHVQQLRQDDELFRQEYDFQKMLIQQVRLRRRQELLNMFAEFEGEQVTDAEDDKTPVVPLASTTDDSLVIPLWKRSGVRVAASVALVAFLGTVLWWQLSDYGARPIAHTKPDSTQVLPSNDTVRPKPVVPSVVAEPQGPVANRSAQPIRLQGPVRLPYYEMDDVRLGFGQHQKTTVYETVVFGIGTKPTYEFIDTLKVYLPTLPAAKPTWSLLYNRATDSYYLQTGDNQYEVVKGLPGRHPLIIVK